jgi:hypothetical protein
MFYTRFDDKNFKDECDTVLRTALGRPSESIVLSDQDVVKALGRAKVGKACGPDKINANVIKHCRRELVVPMKRLFQASLELCYVPLQWRTSEIIPVPKNKVPVEMNDLRPVALTCVLMKCFESIVKDLISADVKGQCDQFQFAYREGKSTEDAVTVLLHTVLSHLDKNKTYTRLLFVDFSSAFNTMQPHILLKKLLDMNVNSNLIRWIYSYLTSRPQYVKLRNTLSGVLFTNTGAPQGCVLSPLLFTLYTNDCVSKSEGCHIIKYADDTVIIGNISNGDETKYFHQVQCFVEWCEYCFLNLNVKKTMEMFVDFRKNKSYDQLVIMNEGVKVVDKYKYLGVYIDHQLNFNENIDHLYKKAVQRLHFVRLLHNIKVDRCILTLFYRSVVESILTFCMTSWFSSISKKNKCKLNKIVRKAHKLGVQTYQLNALNDCKMLKYVNKILKDTEHPLNCHFEFLRSGVRLRSVAHRTSRFGKSFVPSGIRLYNHQTNRH